MGLTATYHVYCDLCDEDSGGGKPSIDEAFAQAAYSGWWTNRGYVAAVCEDCLEANPVPHAQFAGTFCVLCQSGEHTAVIVGRTARMR